MKSEINRGLLRAVIAILATLPLSACEGVGISATDNPDFKLAQADDLLVKQGRIMQARRITEQAIEIFTQRKDKPGLARAYREYALVAKAGGLGNDPVISSDPNRPLTPRPEDLDLTDQNLKAALDLAIETGQLHIAANITFLQGNVQVLRGTPQKACSYYDQALQRFSEADEHEPGNKLQGPLPAEFLASAKKNAGCS